MRQERMKTLAAQADARWAAKPSALDAPDKQQPVQMLQSRDPDSGVTQMNADQEVRDRAEMVQQEESTPPPPVESGQAQQMPQDPPEPPRTEDAPFVAKKRLKKEQKEQSESKDSPWNQAAQQQEWQPKGWSPAPARRKA